MRQEVVTAINRLKERLLETYPDRLVETVLFGSQARDEAGRESDIDVLVVLKGEVNPVAEIKNNSAWISELCLETDESINCVYLSEEQFRTAKIPLLREIRKEGIMI